MTLITKLGYYPKRVDSVYSPVDLDVKDVSVVIPVKDNQVGIDLFLSRLADIESDKLPGEVIIVDNNSKNPINIDENSLEVRTISCSRPGPGAARNEGVAHAQGDWVLFTDSDCVPTSSFVEGYKDAMNGSIGYAGDVKSYTDTFLTQYYDSQHILVPPNLIEDGVIRPEYLVTANALVWKPAFEQIGGFDEHIAIAAGEDVDLAFRLRTIGDLSYAPKSTMLHHFDDGSSGFVKRFFRYGRGTKMVASKHGLDLMPHPIIPEKRSVSHWFLSTVQYASLLAGYVLEK